MGDAEQESVVFLGCIGRGSSNLSGTLLPIDSYKCKASYVGATCLATDGTALESGRTVGLSVREPLVLSTETHRSATFVVDGNDGVDNVVGNGPAMSRSTSTFSSLIF